MTSNKPDEGKMLELRLTADAVAAKQIDRIAGILGIEKPEAIGRAIAAYLFLVEAVVRGHEIAVVKNGRAAIQYVDLALPLDAKDRSP